MRAALLGCVLLLAGCATSNIDAAGLKRGSRVGIVNLMRPHLTHTHVGANQLENFEKWYPTDGSLAASVQNHLVRALKRQYVVVTREPPAALRSLGKDVMQLFQTGLSGPVVSAVQDFARDNRLEHVLIIAEVCSAVPPPRAGRKCGYGLYTGRDAAGALHAWATFDVAVLRVSPYGELLRPDTTLPPSDFVREMTGQLQPADVERVTSAELAQLEPALRALAQRRITDAIDLVH